MATSGSVDFTLTARNVINEAMTLVQVRSEGQTALAPYDAEEARRSLNLMLKTWSTTLHLWLKTESSVVPLLATASYALSTVTTKRYKILSMRRRVSNIDIPLRQLSREEYYDDTPNKAQTGTPLSFYYDPQRASGTIYLWPAPDAAFVANGSLPYTCTRQIQDIDSLDDDLDIPQEWFEAACYSLARRMMIKYPSVDPAARQEIKDAANSLYNQLLAFDQEDTSVFFQPA